VGVSPDSLPSFVVAASLPECLARIDLENRLWFALNAGYGGNDNARTPLVTEYERLLIAGPGAAPAAEDQADE
jgi:hypothetical protein